MQHKWNGSTLIVPTALTARYELAKALAEDTASIILKCTGSAREAYSQRIFFGHSWNYTVHPRQPSTLDIWTTGYESHYARTPLHAGSCNNYTGPKLYYSFTITKTCTGDSPSRCAKPITITFSTWTPSTKGTQRSTRISPTFRHAPRVQPTCSSLRRTVPHALQFTICKYPRKPTAMIAVSLSWHIYVPPNPGCERTS